MVAQLRSLRVDASLEGGAQYATTADQIASANEKMARSFARYDAAQTRTVAGVVPLSNAFIPFYKEEKKFVGAMERINRAMGEGLETSRASVMLENLHAQFGRTASSADPLIQKLVSIAPLLDQLASKQGKMAQLASSFEAVAQMGAAQRQINSLTGVDYSLDINKRYDSQDTYAIEAERLGRKFDPLQAATAKYKAEVTELDRAQDLGSISAAVYGQRLNELKSALLAVSNPSLASSAARQAAMMAEEAAAIGRVTSELSRRQAVQSAAVSEERRVASSVDISVAAFQRYEDSIASASAALSRHKNIALFRSQTEMFRNEYQAAGSRKASDVDQSSLDDLLLGKRSGASARDSAAVFAAQFAEAEEETRRLGVSAKMLRLELDPMGAAMDRLNSEIAEYNAMSKLGLLSTDELTSAISRRQQKFELESANIKRFNNNVRLSSHEMTNLAAQFQDIAVMMAAGQSPFMTIMQQGMQIVPVLGDGQNGIGGAMKRLGAGFAGFLTNPLNVGILGFAALAYAAQVAFQEIRGGGGAAEKTLEKQKTLLSELTSIYQRNGRIVAEQATREATVVEFELRFNNEKAKIDLAKQIEVLQKYSSERSRPFSFAGQGGTATKKAEPEFLRLAEAIDNVSKESGFAQVDVIKLQKEIVALNGVTPQAKIELLGVADALATAQLQINSTSLALDPLASKLSKLYSDPRKFLGNERENSELYNFVPDNRSKREQIEASYADVLKTAAGNTGILIEAENARKSALSSLSAELDKTIALQNLDIQSIYAKTPAQKAAIAAEREYINAMNTGQGADETAIRAAGARKMAYETAAYAISEQTRQMRENTVVELASITAKSPAQKAEIAAIRERNAALNSGASIQEANTRASMAASVAMAQAENQIREANKARMVSANDNIAQQKNELDLVGKSAYQRSLQTANLASYLDLQKQALQNGLGFDQAQYDLLVKKNEEAARYIDLINQAKLNDDIGNERRKLGMSESDGAIFGRLKGAGIEEGSSAWTRASAQLKSLEEDQRSFSFGARRGLEDVAKSAGDYASTIRQGFNDTYQAGEEMWMNFARTGKLSLDGIKTTAIDMLSKLTYQMATSGLMSLFSGGATSTNSGGGFLTSIANVLFSANGNAFNNGNVMAFANGGAFTNSVVSKPTAFNMGMMGEAGPEAIMPLARTSGGKLGVVASGGGGGGMQITYAPVYQISAAIDEVALMRAQRQAIKDFEAKVPQIVGRAIKEGKM